MNLNPYKQVLQNNTSTKRRRTKVVTTCRVFRQFRRFRDSQVDNNDNKDNNDNDDDDDLRKKFNVVDAFFRGLVSFFRAQ